MYSTLFKVTCLYLITVLDADLFTIWMHYKVGEIEDLAGYIDYCCVDQINSHLSLWDLDMLNLIVKWTWRTLNSKLEWSLGAWINSRRLLEIMGSKIDMLWNSSLTKKESARLFVRGGIRSTYGLHQWWKTIAQYRSRQEFWNMSVRGSIITNM